MPSPGNQFLSDQFGDIEDYFISDYTLIDQYIGDRLYVWGDNAVVQLGINNAASRSTPVTTFAGGINWKSAFSGGDTTAAIKTDGTLWVWGDNSALQLGINNAANRSTPVTTFSGGTNWKQVSLGGDHSAAIKTDGTLWVWGDNSVLQLGINNAANRSTPVTTFIGGTNWKQVSAGGQHTAAVKTDGTLWVWGSNIFTQLGINNAANRSTPVTTFAGGTDWKQVSVGDFHTAAIKTDGTLWTWGFNSYGQLGDATTVDRSTPVTTFAGGNNWKQVSLGSGGSAAVKTDGTLWVWGINNSTQLGTNDTSSRSIPVTTFAGGNNWKSVSSGQWNTAAIKTDGTLWVWGNNSFTELGINDAANRSTPVTTFSGGTNWKQVSVGIVNMVAVTAGQSVDFS